MSSIKVPKELFKKKEAGKTMSFFASAELCKTIERQARAAGAKSVSTYISTLLEYVLAEEKKKV